MSNLLKFLNSIIKDLFLTFRIIDELIAYFKNLFILDFYEINKDKEEKINDSLGDSEADKLVREELKKEKTIFFGYGAKNVREYYNLKFLQEDSFVFIDLLWSKIFARKYLLKNTNIFRSYFRVFSTKQGFYFNLLKLKNKKNFNILLINTFLSGFKYIWLGLRFWIFPLIVFFSIIYFTLVLRALPFNKVMFSWICILMFVYWLISGFVFFF